MESPKTRLAVYALAVIALVSTLAALVEAGSAKPNNFDIGSYESRFAEIKREVPRDGTVGYLTDADPGLTSTTAEYYLAQLAMIPTVVANRADTPLVMANVHTPQPAGFYQSRGLQLVKDYGNGVMLLRKEPR